MTPVIEGKGSSTDPKEEEAPGVAVRDYSNNKRTGDKRAAWRAAADLAASVPDLDRCNQATKAEGSSSGGGCIKSPPAGFLLRARLRRRRRCANETGSAANAAGSQQQERCPTAFEARHVGRWARDAIADLVVDLGKRRSQLSVFLS